MRRVVVAVVSEAMTSAVPSGLVILFPLPSAKALANIAPSGLERLSATSGSHAWTEHDLNVGILLGIGLI